MNNILSILFVLLVSIPCIASDMKARYLPTLSQIPEHNITYIFRDRDGYMWYGAVNTLYRDDGYNIETIKIGADCMIRDVSQDLDGNLWVSTDKGAYVIDGKNYQINVFDAGRLKGHPVNNTFFTSDGSAWVNQYGVLHRYDSDRKWVKDYPIAGKGNKGYVTGFSERAPGDIFMTCYSNGVYRYNRARDIFEMFAPTDSDIKLGYLLYDEKNDCFWTNDHEGTMYRFDPYPAPTEPIFVPSDITHHKTPNVKERVHDFTLDQDLGYLWCITRNHLLAFEPTPDGHLRPLELDICNDFEGVSVQDVVASPGLLWVASFDQPCTVVSLHNNNVSFDPLNLLQQRSGNRPLITHLTQDSDSDLIWMLQLRTGLVLYDRKHNKLVYNDETPTTKKMRLNVANNMAPSPHYDGIWVAQERRGMLRAIAQKNLNMISEDSIILTSAVDHSMRVNAIHEDSRGRVWAATSRGLFVYNLGNKGFDLRMPSLRTGSSIVEDDNHNIWLAARDSCIYKFPAADIHSRVRYEIPGFFSAITTADNNKLWIGTDDGSLFLFDPEANTYSEHTALSGLLQAPIINILPGPDNKVWVLSEQRLVEYHPDTQTFNLYKGGIDIEAERFLAASSTSNGNLLLGTIGGLAYISPDNIPDTVATSMKPHVTDVTVEGKSRLFTDIDTAYDPKELNISSEDRNIVFHLSNHDNINADKVRYAYRMKGFDKQWSYTKRGSNKATYSYLPKGKYTLEVKVCDSHNRWSDPVNVMTVNRKPALYETWWAYCIFILIAIGIITYAVLRYRTHLYNENQEMWSDSTEMIKMRQYLESPVSLPDEEFRHLDILLVSKATEVVEAHLAEPEFDVNDLASGCNMSRSSFTRKIKAITNLTPLEFIKDIKMKHARHMLESQNYTVSEVAEKLGFANRRYFTASFRKATGLNPSEYLRDKHEDTKDDENKPEEG